MVMRGCVYILVRGCFDTYGILRTSLLVKLKITSKSRGANYKSEGQKLGLDEYLAKGDMLLNEYNHIHR